MDDSYEDLNVIKANLCPFISFLSFFYPPTLSYLVAILPLQFPKDYFVIGHALRLKQASIVSFCRRQRLHEGQKRLVVR